MYSTSFLIDSFFIRLCTLINVVIVSSQFFGCSHWKFQECAQNFSFDVLHHSFPYLGLLLLKTVTGSSRQCQCRIVGESLSVSYHQRNNFSATMQHLSLILLTRSLWTHVYMWVSTPGKKLEDRGSVLFVFSHL